MDSFYKSNRDYNRVYQQILESKNTSKANKKTISEYLQRLQAENISALRIRKYMFYLKDICSVTQVDFTKYTSKELQAIFAYLNSKKLATHTVNDYIIAIKKFLKFVQGERYNPKKYEWLKKDRKSPNKFDITYNDLITKDELKKLIATAKAPMYKCLISLAYESGARPSELLTLTIGSLNFAEGYTRIAIRESKTFTRTIYAMDSDKYLKAWLVLHPLNKDRDAPLFISSYINYERKDFLLPETYNLMLKRFSRRAGINKRVFSYILRHSRITHLLEAGWNEVMIKKLVGHSLESRSFKFYEHLAERQVEEYILKQKKKERAELKSRGIIEFAECNFCHTENDLKVDFCVQCARPISLKGLMETEDKKAGEMKSLEHRMQEMETLLRLMPQIKELARREGLDVP